MTHPTELYDLDEKQLLERIAGASPNSEHAFSIRMEFERRAAVAQLSAARSAEASAQAGIKASEYAKTAADHARATAKWTMISAIAIALSTALVAVTTYTQVQSYVSARQHP